MSTAETVHDRIDFAIGSFTPMQIALGLGLVTFVTAILLFAQEPMVHDAMHNFRHAVGVTCH